MPHIADDTSGLTLLGNRKNTQAVEEPAASILEAFPNRFPGRLYVVSIVFPEFTSLCPVTGQPDFGTICLEYIPDELCVESKSYKLYLFAYRSHKSFMETITNTILDDIVQLLNPCWCRVKGLFVPRGGTRIHVFAENFKDLPGQRASSVSDVVKAWRTEANPHGAF